MPDSSFPNVFCQASPQRKYNVKHTKGVFLGVETEQRLGNRYQHPPYGLLTTTARKRSFAQKASGCLFTKFVAVIITAVEVQQ